MRPGDRIELVSMPSDPDPVEAGTQGTIVSVSRVCLGEENPWFQIDVNWDNGRTLMLCVPPDKARVIS